MFPRVWKAQWNVGEHHALSYPGTLLFLSIFFFFLFPFPCPLVFLTLSFFLCTPSLLILAAADT